MANRQHLSILKRGTDAWNAWRAKKFGHLPYNDFDKEYTKWLRPADLSHAELRGAKLSRIDLIGANLRGADLFEADLEKGRLWLADFSNATLVRASLRRALLIEAHFNEADLTEANFRGADLRDADLSEADLTEANLSKTNLQRADLSQSDFTEANLRGANLSGACLNGACLRDADLTGADLTNADLTEATLIRTNLKNAILNATQVYGISAWDLKLEGAIQTSLFLTPQLTVDNLEVAQFIYLLLNNARIRAVIDTITSKVVLILGRFTPERKATLNALRDALRNRNYLPIVFDFEKPTNRDFTETVLTLASLSRFVIADLTDPRSVPQELTAIIPQLQSVPIRPLLFGDQGEWAMFRDLARRPQVMAPFHYTDDARLLDCLGPAIIEPAEQRARELAGR